MVQEKSMHLAQCFIWDIFGALQITYSFMEATVFEFFTFIYSFTYGVHMCICRSLFLYCSFWDCQNCGKHLDPQSHLNDPNKIFVILETIVVLFSFYLIAVNLCKTSV